VGRLPQGSDPASADSEADAAPDCRSRPTLNRSFAVWAGQKFWNRSGINKVELDALKFAIVAGRFKWEEAEDREKPASGGFTIGRIGSTKTPRKGEETPSKGER
jgi:hypothetical protein